MQQRWNYTSCLYYKCLICTIKLKKKKKDKIAPSLSILCKWNEPFWKNAQFFFFLPKKPLFPSVLFSSLPDLFSFKLDKMAMIEFDNRLVRICDQFEFASNASFFIFPNDIFIYLFFFFLEFQIKFLVQNTQMVISFLTISFHFISFLSTFETSTCSMFFFFPNIGDGCLNYYYWLI